MADPVPTTTPPTESEAWRNLIIAAAAWDRHMDQWNKAAIRLPNGRTVYLTIGSSAQHVESFDPVHPDGSRADA